MDRPKIAATQITRTERLQNDAVQVSVVTEEGATEQITLSPLAAEQLAGALLSLLNQADTTQIPRVAALAVGMNALGEAILEFGLGLNQIARFHLDAKMAHALRRKLDPNDPLDGESPNTGPAH